MKKFKIGETYRVSKGKEKGDHIKITGVTISPVGYVRYECETVLGSSNNIKFFFGGSIFAERLEPVKKPECKIVITTDGKTTTAKLYDGRETIRAAKAVCSDSDTFDFNIGAFLAVERLTGCRLENISLTTGRPKPKTLPEWAAEQIIDVVVKAAAESLRNRLKERITNEKTGGTKHE